MPCYKLLTWARSDATPAELASTFRGLARLVYREQGQFRTIQNHGVRPLAWPVRKPYEKHEEARLVEAVYDISPAGKSVLDSYLKSAKPVLLSWHLKQTDKLAEFRRYVKNDTGAANSMPPPRCSADCMRCRSLLPTHHHAHSLLCCDYLHSLYRGVSRPKRKPVTASMLRSGYVFDPETCTVVRDPSKLVAAAQAEHRS